MIQKYFMLHNPNNDGKPSVKHPTYDLAYAEATRLISAGAKSIVILEAKEVLQPRGSGVPLPVREI